MMTRDGGCNREQIEFTSLEDLVPEDHLVRKLENAIDWSFIYEMVNGSYCEDNGRPSLDPVILIKLAVVQYMFGIRSMRQTIQEIKVNNAYRWFLGLVRLGNKLKNVRKTRGLTQEELSALSGVSTRHISKIEKGVMNP